MNKRKILCCCSGGKVRSISTKYVLEDFNGFENVLTAGLHKTHPETLKMLFEWADHIIISGEKALYDLVASNPKAIHFDVGEDTYYQYANPKLVGQVKFLVTDWINKE